MRDLDQTFTVFGGAFVSESHGSHCLPVETRTHPCRKMAVAAAILLLGVSTATATKAIRGADGLRPQASHSTWMVAGFEDAVY